MNQRFQWLSFTHQDGGLAITAPTSRNITPPGALHALHSGRENDVPSVAKIVKVGSGSDTPPPNTPPAAGFTSSCTGLACTFTDGSKDDGSVVGWSWDFGDNTGTSPAQSPSYTYGAEGSYEVTLTATDNTGMTGTVKHTVAITLAPPPPPPPIALTVTGRTDATKQYMTLKWSGASGTTVDVYRNGPLLLNTPNDGLYTNSRTFLGAITYTYKVCQAGTSTCSNEASVTFNNRNAASAPSILLTDRYRHPIRVQILRDAAAEHCSRRLNAGDLLCEHSRMKCVQMWDTQTGTAASGREVFRRPSRHWPLRLRGEARVAPRGCKLGPGRRFELQRQLQSVSVKRDRPLHITYEDNDVFQSHEVSSRPGGLLSFADHSCIQYHNPHARRTIACASSWMRFRWSLPVKLSA